MKKGYKVYTALSMYKDVVKYLRKIGYVSEYTDLKVELDVAEYTPVIGIFVFNETKSFQLYFLFRDEDPDNFKCIYDHLQTVSFPHLKRLLKVQS